MENASKALMMAAGTLIGIMLLAILVYFANNLGIFPTELNQEQKTEQIQAFNTEYEAYNKKLMYGTDLISVLNKAKSNNEKYVKGNFLIGQEYPKEYIINIKFKLKKPLEDVVTVSYLSVKKELNPDGTVKSYSGSEIDYTADKGVENNPYEKKLLEIFSPPSSRYESDVSGVIDNNTKLITKTYQSTIFNNVTNYYILCQLEVDGTPKADINDNINALLNCSAAITRVVKNKTKIIEEKQLTFYKNGTRYDGWSSAEWKTCLYDLKTRKFKCTNTKYNEDTGRIVEMVFEEF